ncbi:MAG: glutamine-hydrolyzing carbamoyl-phosphate synthase small subunit [Thermodesulfovibrionales bacterium]
MGVKALLVLGDGTVFEGKALGAEGETIGEVVFNTSMTGYQEILTDPSYKGQIVTMTYTQIGNYGVNREDIESCGSVKAEGFVVKEACAYPSNWRSSLSLSAYLRESGVVGIQGVDTRALTRHLRMHGAQMGIISTLAHDAKALHEKVKAHPGISSFDYVQEVTTKDAYEWSEGCWKWGICTGTAGGAQDAYASRKKMVVYDFGVKLNILRNLTDAGFSVTVVPATMPAEAVLEMNPDAVLLSNGPGDPERITYGIGSAKKLLGRKPLFGICLGHQILGLAMGGRTYKLKFGHHGGNHPVKDLSTGRVEITSQNHNYCVDIASLKGKVELTHRNLFDGSEEGMRHIGLPVFSVQHHPEAGPGPNDSAHLFSRFHRLTEEWKF